MAANKLVLEDMADEIIETDVLIIGGGLAGSTAAIRLKENKKIDVTVLSYQTFIIPVFAVVIGWIFLRETVTIRIVAGAALILAGIALATLRGKRRRKIQTTGQE